MKNMKALVGFDWDEVLFSQREKYIPRPFGRKIIVNIFFVTISNRMETRDTVGDSDGTLYYISPILRGPREEYALFIIFCWPFSE